MQEKSVENSPEKSSNSSKANKAKTVKTPTPINKVAAYMGISTPNTPNKIVTCMGISNPNTPIKITSIKEMFSKLSQVLNKGQL